MNGKLSQNILNKTKLNIAIEVISIKLLIEAYSCAMVDKRYDVDWNEDQFTNYLINFMRKLPFSKKHSLDIAPQYQLLKDELPIGNNNPKTLPIIDIRIFTWQLPNQKEYFFEAKNLSQNDWTKKSGAKVSASYYQKRYIDTGIENFRIGRYYDASLVGYILEGKVLPIIDKLNIRLSKSANTINKLEPLLYTASFKDICSSTHLTPSGDNLHIKHIFLKFV